MKFLDPQPLILHHLPIEFSDFFHMDGAELMKCVCVRARVEPFVSNCALEGFSWEVGIKTLTSREK